MGLRVRIAATACLVLAGCRSERPASRACGPSIRTPQKYAVLVNGDTELRHNENILEATETLLALGFRADNLRVLTTRDRRVQLPQGVNRLPATPGELARVLDELAGLMQPGDLVLFYGTGHGDTSVEGESLLELARGELWALDLRDAVERLRGDTIFVFDQCFSGGFAEALEGTKARAIVMTSVDGKHETDCYHFARGFWSALMHPKDADRNHDGKTSVREAYDMAQSAHAKALAGDPELKANGVYRTFNGLRDAVLN